MGYRSDVSLTIEKHDFDKLLEEIKEYYQVLNSVKAVISREIYNCLFCVHGTFGHDVQKWKGEL